MRTSIIVFLWSLATLPVVANACEEWAAMVVSANGYVVVKDGGATASSATPNSVSPARADSVVCPGQQLEVGRNSRAAIYLSNNSFVRLSENTVMSFPATQNEGSFWVELKQGVSHFISRITLRFGVKTAYTNAVVDGTEFLVSAHSDRTQVSVVEGSVSVTIGQQGIQVPVAAGEGVVVDGSPQFKRIQLSATESVDWAVYFPPLVVVDELTTSQHSTALQQAKQHLSQSRPDLAIQTLEAITEPDSAIAVALAASYLSVGHVARAEQALSQVQSAQAQALRSLIAVLTNQPQQAVAIATGSEARTLSQYLALSYAYQANLEMPRALQAAREASAQFPDQSAAWVRLSELQVAMGDVGAAADSIAKARQLTPQDSAALVQSAYVDLFNNRFQEAEAQFRQAIAQHSEDPQARLGLGLVLLRQGDLEAGRKQLEFAVSLDPARSVLRSYLGRAYFEEKRDDEASVQWELAMQLDPEDPTAYFYEGVRKLYSNDPIAAIEELEKSRQLNDERALYRSETLLQSDEASRSAVLARAYDESGYRRGLEIAAWEALQLSPTSAEGHRLLSDKYRGNSRYEIARASELLQSQLWQSNSAYPLQPQLAETSIVAVDGAGPQRPGYNEYHPLFLQDGVYGSVSAYVAGDATWADDLIGTVLAGPFMLSMGQYHFESDGWRENTGQEQDIYDLLLQYEFMPGVRVQYEHRELKWDLGYLAPELGTDFDRHYQEETERDTDRIALISSASDDFGWLLSYRKNEYVNEGWSDPEAMTNGALLDENSHTYDAQVKFKIGGVLWTAGIERSEIEYTEDYNATVSGELVPGFFFESSDDVEIDSDGDILNAYLYFDFDITKRFRANFGLAYVDDEYAENVEGEHVDQFNPPFGPATITPIKGSFKRDSDEVLPKVGLEYNIDSDSRLLLAAFKGWSRPNSVVQSVEPTVFSGFNQMFNDPERSLYEAKALSWDGAFSDIYFGVGGMQRSIQYSLFEAFGAEYSELEAEENSIDIDIFWPVSKAISFSMAAEWVDTKLDGHDGINLGIQDVERYYVPLMIGLFGQSNASVQISQSYYKQRISEAGSAMVADDSTWITSVHFKYRFESVRSTLIFGVNNVLNEEDEYLGGVSEVLAFYPGRQLFANFSLNI
ncbi:MAG: TonB-dependent receptor [Pseudomonadota bacterium]|nr:TonB-dependent receptor [Pseudomonadota bacterium]